MARPELTGCPYFPLDCSYYNDRKLKLLRGEFGGKAETVVVRLWCMIYADAGYYVKVDDDDVALLADSLGRGFEVGYIKEVIWGSCKRGLFDLAVFTQFHILTSKGAQRRYCEIKKKKKIISVIREYWLLKDTDFEGTDEELLLKLRFFSIYAEKTTVNSEETAVNEEETPQRKVKKSKGKESKESAARTQCQGEPEPEVLDLFSSLANGNQPLMDSLTGFYFMRQKMKKPLTLTGAQRLCTKLPRLAKEAGVQNAAAYMTQVLDESIMNSWQGIFPLKSGDFRDSAPADTVHVGQAGDRPRMISEGEDITAYL